MGKKGVIDIDKGYKKILQSVKELCINGINVGITSDKINKKKKKRSFGCPICLLE